MKTGSHYSAQHHDKSLGSTMTLHAGSFYIKAQLANIWKPSESHGVGCEQYAGLTRETC